MIELAILKMLPTHEQTLEKFNEWKVLLLRLRMFEVVTTYHFLTPWQLVNWHVHWLDSYLKDVHVTFSFSWNGLTMQNILVKIFCTLAIISIAVEGRKKNDGKFCNIWNIILSSSFLQHVKTKYWCNISLIIFFWVYIQHKQKTLTNHVLVFQWAYFK